MDEKKKYSELLGELIELKNSLVAEHMNHYLIDGVTLQQLHEMFELKIGNIPDNRKLLELQRKLSELLGMAFAKLRDAQSVMDVHRAYLKQQRAAALSTAIKEYGTILRRLPSKEISEFIDSLVGTEIIKGALVEADAKYWESVVTSLNSIGWRLRDMTIAVASEAKRESLPANDGDIVDVEDPFEHMIKGENAE